MADFNAIVADVMTITNRPDLEKETQLAVKSATLQLHRQDFFYKDIEEVAIRFDSKDYIQSIDYRTLFPEYRALKYLRKYDPAGVGSAQGAAGQFFHIVDPSQVLDSYDQARADIAYVAGSVIQIKSSTAIEYALIGIYKNPVVTPPEKYSSWISDEARYAIVYQAASIVFGSTLRDIQGMNANRALAMQEFEQVKNSNIVAEGY